MHITSNNVNYISYDPIITLPSTLILKNKELVTLISQIFYMTKVMDYKNFILRLLITING